MAGTFRQRLRALEPKKFSDYGPREITEETVDTLDGLVVGEGDYLFWAFTTLLAGASVGLEDEQPAVYVRFNGDTLVAPDGTPTATPPEYTPSFQDDVTDIADLLDPDFAGWTVLGPSSNFSGVIDSTTTALKLGDPWHNVGGDLVAPGVIQAVFPPGEYSLEIVWTPGDGKLFLADTRAVAWTTG